jgi:hypothetical protein
MIPETATAPIYKLVEECAGEGEIDCNGRTYPGVAYGISRFQGMSRSGLPVPGLHRFEGSIDVAALPDAERLVDRDLTLRLEDGRTIRITLASADGRVFQVGHGPSRCSCC